jgi:hypothetical protein
LLLMKFYGACFWRQQIYLQGLPQRWPVKRFFGAQHSDVPAALVGLTSGLLVA